MKMETNKYEYDINYPVTIFNFSYWGINLMLGYYTLFKMIPYLNTLEEPLKLLGVIFLLYSIMKWVMWMGIPNIEYKNYRTIKKR